MNRVLTLIVIGLLVVGTACGADIAPSITPTSIAAPPIEEIVVRVSPTVVRIIAQGAMGSGMIVDSDGYILTASHVVEGVTSVTVGLNNREQLAGKVVGRDEANDLAIVKIERDSLPTISFGDSSKLKPGQEVVAIGYPLDLSGGVTVTKGIISAMRGPI